MKPEIRFSTPRNARRRVVDFVMRSMLSRSALGWRLERPMLRRVSFPRPNRFLTNFIQRRNGVLPEDEVYLSKSDLSDRPSLSIFLFPEIPLSTSNYPKKLSKKFSLNMQPHSQFCLC